MLEQKSKNNLMKNMKFDKEIDEIKQKMQLRSIVDTRKEGSADVLSLKPNILRSIQS